MRKILEIEGKNPDVELPRLIRKGIRINYHIKNRFAFYYEQMNIVCLYGTEALLKLEVEDKVILLSKPKPLDIRVEKSILAKFLTSYLFWRLERLGNLITKVRNDLYFYEQDFGKMDEELILSVLKGFTFEIIEHQTGFYIVIVNKYLPRIKPTLDRILTIEELRGSYDFIRGEYWYDGPLKGLDVITIDDYYKLGKPSYAGRIDKIVFSDTPIYEDLKDKILKYYEKERDEIRSMISKSAEKNVPIILTIKGRGEPLRYLSSILLLAPSQDQLITLLDVLGFTHVLRWYYDIINPTLEEYLNLINEWSSYILRALEELPVTGNLEFIKLEGE